MRGGAEMVSGVAAADNDVKTINYSAHTMGGTGNQFEGHHQTRSACWAASNHGISWRTITRPPANDWWGEVDSTLTDILRISRASVVIQE